MDQLGFERKPMVRWLSPLVLLEAAVRVVVSTLFGEYADRRELQAVLDRTPGAPLSYGDEDERDGAVWIDFVADLGDGFDSTYAMACLLAAPSLAPDGEALPRGRALVMGGDEVYPVASREQYENRFRGPYAAAWPEPDGRPADLLAIPGNHDWYDGLTNFLRFFCAERRIGAWQTQQKRSYFAIQLPHRWWLLAIDIQLDTFIDEPQLDYFRGIDLQPGDRVILVTGKPSWVKVKPEKVPDSHKNLEYFVEKIVTPAQARVRVTLTGDLHHYCRYESADGELQLITSGGGGAYLFPTHTMPPALDLPEGKFTQERCYPTHADSEELTKGARKLFRLAPGLCATIAGFYSAFAAALFAALAVGPGWSAAAAVVGLTMLAALAGYADAKGFAGKLWLGGRHCAAHLALAAIPALVAGILWDPAWLVLPVAAVAAALGYFGGGWIFGEYLILAHRKAEKHANEVLACQGIPDFKNFLRMRLDADGLTIFPIGVPRVPREWTPAPDDSPQEPWLRPADGETLETVLIEPAVQVGP